MIFFLQQFNNTMSWRHDMNDRHLSDERARWLIYILDGYTQFLKINTDDRFTRFNLDGFVICDVKRLQEEDVLIRQQFSDARARLKILDLKISQEFIARHYHCYDIVLSSMEEVKKLSDFSLDCLYRIHDQKMIDANYNVGDMPHGLTKRDDQLKYFELLLQGGCDFNELRLYMSADLQQGIIIRQFFEGSTPYWEMETRDKSIVVKESGGWGGQRVFRFLVSEHETIWSEPCCLQMAKKFITKCDDPPSCVIS
jgi:hypothetical protein